MYDMSGICSTHRGFKNAHKTLMKDLERKDQLVHVGTVGMKVLKGGNFFTSLATIISSLKILHHLVIVIEA